MPKPVISVEHLTKRYDLGVIGTGTLSRDLNRWWARVRGQSDPYTRIGQRDAFERIGESILALDDVSFTVEQGEALGIIGRNGAGKSTLLKILSRVTAPTSGVVKVKGRIGSLLEVGTGFHPELTGRENIYLNGAILGMKKAEVARKFDEIVDFAGVEKFIDTPVKRYSSGMYVRLAFAVAAHLESEILIVDEVLAVGDAEFQNKCLGKMEDVATREGRTVLFVSHNIVSIRRLCINGILLNTGYIEAIGPIETILNSYMTEKNNRDYSKLAERKDRKGNKALIFTHVEVLDDSMIPNNIKLGSPTKINIRYKGQAHLNKVTISLGIYNQFGERVSLLNNEVAGQPFSQLPSNGILTISFEKFPFSPGTYNLNLSCEVDNSLADWVTNVSRIRVFPGDYYNSGNPPPLLSGPIMVENHWGYQPLE